MTISKIWTGVQVYGSIPLLLVLTALTIYFIKIKRWQRFELTILVLMFLKYILAAFTEVFHEREGIFKNNQVVMIYVTFKLTLGPICHWIYASQYTKTFWLTSGIIKKACLLCYKHHKLLESSSLKSIPSSLQYHEIESGLNE